MKHDSVPTGDRAVLAGHACSLRVCLANRTALVARQDIPTSDWRLPAHVRKTDHRGERVRIDPCMMTIGRLMGLNSMDGFRR